jgi:hypothetical protein
MKRLHMNCGTKPTNRKTRKMTDLALSLMDAFLRRVDQL